MTLAAVEVARKKQLGQYFTGRSVGRLLAALAGAQTASSIIDPMVGSGDLLMSCLEVGAQPRELVGVDLDPLALAQAEYALKGVKADLVLGDAFSVPLPADQFDLVVTNPPYIRYQSRGEVDGRAVPSAEAVRDGLIGAVRERPDLSPAFRSRLLRAATDYPGTADIAVPAWILCASLVREGGVLAVVAPQAWLSRRYAQVVRQLLDEAFEVDFIVEDGDASWFADAQVRTQLVVARRREVAVPHVGHSVVVARATKELAIGGSLRGSLSSEAEVATKLRQVASREPVPVTAGLSAHLERELRVAASSSEGYVPARVTAALNLASGFGPTRTLASYGWEVGQGLRTGANDFFYVREVDGAIRPASRWGISELPIPSECLLPAVRRQNELGPHLAVGPGDVLTSRIVNLRGWVTRADALRMGAGGEARVLPAVVAEWIEQVANSPLAKKQPTKLFPQLAAVAPNARRDRSGQPVSFWYQLPDLSPRHRPQLLMGRVCGGQPTTYANCVGAVVDANFSTLWPSTADALPRDALLALLHSSWVWANLEATCTVLGGGALKVEATDLRRLPLPELTGDDIGQLEGLGRSLRQAAASGLVLAIDGAVVSSLAGGPRTSDWASGLRAFAQTACANRSRQ